MNPDEILEIQGHRPIRLPRGKWIMRQAWRDLLLAHWPIDKELIASFIPKQLQLDLWEGAAWVSISPFFVHPLKIRWLPPLPLVRSFFELNTRTYVSYGGKPGIYLFSADAASRLAVEGARLAGLPYLNADIRMERRNEEVYFSCLRKDKRANSVNFTGTYYPTSSETFHASPNTILYWLTERYRLYTVRRNGIVLAADIHHMPWPLQTAELVVDQNTMGLTIDIELPRDKPLLTYTKRQDVLIWPMRKV